MATTTPALLLFQAALMVNVPAEPLLRGSVTDAETGEPVAGAVVTSGDEQALSDASGRFELRLPRDVRRLRVEAPRHLARTLDVNVQRPAAPLHIRLFRKPRVQEVVTVQAAGEPAAPPDVLPLRPGAVLAVAGAAENVFRALATLPGIAGTDEFGSRLAVRGGGPDQNLTVLDGVEIHDPYRLFGLTSAFNPASVESFELTAGGFGVKHGDRLSSLLVVKNRDGTRAEAFAGSAALGLTDANLVLEGRLPGTRPGSWLLTGRRTYYDLAAERFVDDDLPAFRDVQLRAAWEPAPRRRLTLFALTSRQDADLTVDGDRPGESGAFSGDAADDLASLTYTAPLGERGLLTSVASYYTNVETLDVDARFQTASRRSNAPGDEGEAFADVVFDRRLAVRDASLRSTLALQVAPRHLLETGVELHRLRTGVALTIRGGRNPTAANGSSVRGGAGLPDALDSNRTSTRAALFLQDRFRVTPRLTLEGGLRADWSGVAGDVAWQPRLAAELRLSGATRLHAAFGRYSQSPGYEKLVQADYLVDLSAAERLELAAERAGHAILGLAHDLGGGHAARVEVYYKEFDHLLVGRLETEAERRTRLARFDFPRELAWGLPSEPLVTSFPTNDGDGRAWGVDLLLKRRASAGRRLAGWLSYSFGRAERDAYGRRFPFDYDRRHAASLVLDWRAAAWLDLAATLRAASGFPRTPAVGLRLSDVADARDRDGDSDRTERVPERDAAGRLVYLPDLGGVSNLNSARLPIFARLDLRATFHLGGRGGRWQLYLDVINATNRENAGVLDPVLEYDPDSDRPRLSEERSQSLPLLPSVGVRFRF